LPIRSELFSGERLDQHAREATEEGVVSRDVTEHTETVRGTVRETKVEIDKPGASRRLVWPRSGGLS
jgi:hypothetical protein